MVIDTAYNLVPDNNVKYLEKEKQQTFISKVYTTIWFQIIFVGLFIALCKNNRDISTFMVSSNGFGLLFILFNLFIIFTVATFCCFDLIRRRPYNWIYIITMTLIITYFLSFISLGYSGQMLLIAGLTTLLLFCGLTIYSWQTKIDFTMKGNLLLLSLLGLIMIGIFNVSLPSGIPFMQIIYPILGSLIFSFYVVYDTQLMISKNKFNYEYNDYAIASINIFLDLVNLFLFLLELLNIR
tara:strand:+ start:1139 stop:1855 length:717 start_codon:yes stop_codon:yes gene_type:complete